MSSQFTIKISIPHICALAGLVPWALLGIIQIFLLVSEFFSWYFCIANKPANSPCAPALGWSETASKPVISFNIDINSLIISLYPSRWWGSKNGCAFEKPGKVIGSISDAAFNFIVQDPRGIIDLFKATSLFSNFFKYLIISVSEW